MTSVRIPKRVAGVKIPKKARKKANKALKAIDNPIVQGLAGAAFARTAWRERPEQEAEECVSVEIDAAAPAETFKSAAIDGLRAFLEGLEQGLRENGREERPGASAH
jgi:hypothetical protein